MNSASAPTLLMKAERIEVMPPSAPIWTDARRPPCWSRCWESSAIRAEPDNARLRISTAATVMTAGCPNPWKAATGSMRPSTTAIRRALNATRS